MTETYLMEGRLADVIAAITTLGTYKFYKLEFSGWSDRISGSFENANHWETVFREHPEFFRMNSTGDQASLVWRRQKSKTYNVDTQLEIQPKELKTLSPQAAERISRTPLAPPEIAALIDTAVRLHEAALDRKESNRWWIPVLSAVLGFLGAILGSSLGDFMK